MQSVILTTPILLIGYALALFFCIYDLAKRATGYVFTALSATIFTAVSGYALLLGAELFEVAAVALILLALNLLSYRNKTGGEE